MDRCHTVATTMVQNKKNEPGCPPVRASAIHDLPLDPDPACPMATRPPGPPAVGIVGMLLPNEASVDVPVNVVSGLPIGYFKENLNRFQDLLVGRHTVTYHSPDGRKTNKEFIVNGVGWLNDLTQEKYKKPFMVLNEQERETVLRQIEQSKAGRNLDLATPWGMLWRRTSC